MAEKESIPFIKLSGSSRFTIPGLGEGRVSGSGRISPEEINVSGSSTMPGGMKVGLVEASGSSTFKGDIEADRMDLSGSASIEGSARFKRLTKSGSLRIGGDAVGGSMDVSGSTHVEGSVNLGEKLRASGSLEVGEDVVVGDLVELDGSFRVGGRIKAKTLDAWLSREMSRVEGGIEAARTRTSPQVPLSVSSMPRPPSMGRSSSQGLEKR